jgi:hypothetical protein
MSETIFRKKALAFPGFESLPIRENSSAIAPPGRDENLGSTAPRDSALCLGEAILAERVELDRIIPAHPNILGQG